MDHYARAYPVFSRIKGFYNRGFQDMLCSLRRFLGSEVAQHSTPPHRVRTSNVHQKIINFIKELRERYPKIGEKIKPLLDKYCAENSLKTISESTIERVTDGVKDYFYNAEDSNSCLPILVVQR